MLAHAIKVFDVIHMLEERQHAFFSHVTSAKVRRFRFSVAICPIRKVGFRKLCEGRSQEADDCRPRKEERLPKGFCFRVLSQDEGRLCCTMTCERVCVLKSHFKGCRDSGIIFGFSTYGIRCEETKVNKKNFTV